MKGQYRTGATRLSPAKNSYENLQERIHAETGIVCTVKVQDSYQPRWVEIKTDTLADYYRAKACLKWWVKLEIRMAK